MSTLAADLIQKQAERFRIDFGLAPVTAAEVEFYLHGAEACGTLEAFWQDVSARCEAQGIVLAKHEKERGRGQYEIALSPVNDPVKTANDVVTLKDIVAVAAEAHGITADFSAKPLENEPGSGLHIHIHLADAQGKNTFYKKDDVISDTLRHSIGGLLAWLPECMPVFAPSAASYARIVAGSNAPVTASWGANNRTVAVRLPDKPPANKHIEHRAAGADADPVRVMAVLLAAMHDGLTRKLAPGEQIYGDAALPMYALPPLPQSLAAARASMEASPRVRQYFAIEALWPST